MTEQKARASGNALYRMRIEKGLSPTSVAKKLGITYSALWRMENSERRTVSANRAAQLAEIYEVPIERVIKELISETEQHTPQQTA